MKTFNTNPRFIFLSTLELAQDYGVFIPDDGLIQDFNLLDWCRKQPKPFIWEPMPDFLISNQGTFTNYNTANSGLNPQIWTWNLRN